MIFAIIHEDIHLEYGMMFNVFLFSFLRIFPHDFGTNISSVRHFLLSWFDLKLVEEFAVFGVISLVTCIAVT